MAVSPSFSFPIISHDLLEETCYLHCHFGGTGRSIEYVSVSTSSSIVELNNVAASSYLPPLQNKKRIFLDLPQQLQTPHFPNPNNDVSNLVTTFVSLILSKQSYHVQIVSS